MVNAFLERVLLENGGFTNVTPLLAELEPRLAPS